MLDCDISSSFIQDKKSFCAMSQCTSNMFRKLSKNYFALTGNLAVKFGDIFWKKDGHLLDSANGSEFLRLRSPCSSRVVSLFKVRGPFVYHEQLPLDPPPPKPPQMSGNRCKCQSLLEHVVFLLARKTHACTNLIFDLWFCRFR